MKTNTKVVPLDEMVSLGNEDGLELVDAEMYTKEQFIASYLQWYGIHLQKRDIRVVWIKQNDNGIYTSVKHKPTKTTKYKKYWIILDY